MLNDGVHSLGPWGLGLGLGVGLGAAPFLALAFPPPPCAALACGASLPCPCPLLLLRLFEVQAQGSCRIYLLMFEPSADAHRGSSLNLEESCLVLTKIQICICIQLAPL